MSRYSRKINWYNWVLNVSVNKNQYLILLRALTDPTIKEIVYNNFSTSIFRQSEN